MRVQTDSRVRASALPRSTSGLQRDTLIWLIAMVILPAMLLNLAFWWLQARSGAVQPADPEEYYRAAVHILHGGYDDNGKWLRPPLYPALLALLLWLGNMNVSLALLGQALITGMSTLVFALHAWWLFRRLEIALLSGLLAALFVPLASFGSVLFAEALFIPLIVLALALLDRVIVTRHWAAALLCGVVLGLATLTRAVALFFLPISALLVLGFSLLPERTRELKPSPSDVSALQTGKSTPFPVTNGRRIMSALLLAAMLVLGALLTIGPWTTRNYLVHHRLILVDTNGGISMWYGTVQGEQDRLQGEARLAAVANPADRQALAVQMTVERIMADPWLFLSRMRYKVASLFTLQLRNFATGELVTISPQDDLVVMGAGENPLRLTFIADAQYIVITLLGIIGLSFAPAWRRMLPVLLWFSIGVLLSAITVAHPRLRLPLVCVLIPYSAYALAHIPAAIWQPWRFLRDRRILIALAGCLVFLGMIFSWRYVPWLQGENYARPARLAVAQGNYAQAYSLFEQARIVDPTNALRFVDLADLAFRQGDLDAAADLYRQASDLEQRNLYAHAMRIQTAALQGWPDVAQTELDAIASYGRDNNDLYAWAWHTARTPPPTRVIPGDPMALGHFTGFAPVTDDLTEGRWTLGHGQVRLSGGCSTVHLHLRGPSGRIVRVWLEGSGIEQYVILNSATQTITLALDNLPDCTDNTPLIVHIQSDTSLLDLERAPWYVGVAVLEASIAQDMVSD